MNDIKVNFKAAPHYFECLKEVINRFFIIIEQIKNEELLSKDELDFAINNLVHIFMVIQPILDISEFKNKLLTKDEEKLLNWFYQKRALWLKEHHPQIFDTLPSDITKHYYSFTDKGKEDVQLS